MTIVMGADHGGFELKEAIKAYLTEQGIEILDAGTHEPTSCDYPDIAERAAKEYFANKADYLILSCGTGIGVSIAANKIEGIYCALVYDMRTARLAKSHNDANAIALGGRELTVEVAKEVVDTFLNTEASKVDRHIARRDKMKALDARGGGCCS